jgi:hypothetical protein
MNEKQQFRDVLIKVALVVLCATLYCLGGADFGPGKWVRRFGMPLVLSGSIFWFSRDWRAIITLPMTILGTSLGYGADETFLKIVKRLYCGVALGVGSSMADLLNKRFLIAVFQAITVTATMIVLGVWNVLPNARIEEFCIGFVICLFPIMSARRKE